MIAGIPREVFPQETRVALVPAEIPRLAKGGIDCLIETGAGEASGYPDAAYNERGARLAAERAEVFASSDVVLVVRGCASGSGAGQGDLELLRRGQAVIGMLDPQAAPEAARALAATGATSFAMELMPRIARAQSMDVLSSMATVAGYKAVLMAADTLPRMFPMLMTAAGTITPARLFVIGAGVAGLQAIATARRLGAVVEAFDVRPAVREQVQSLGAKFVELPVGTSGAEDPGGYARAQDDAFYLRQRAAMARVVAQSDVVIATAVIPGRKAPVLITGDMVARMPQGSVIVDLAAERGGNCEWTCPGETVVKHGVTIHGPVNLPASLPYHASQMYSRNIAAFLLHLVKDRRLRIDVADAITRETLVTQGGEVVHAKIREALGLVPAPAAS